MQAQTKTLIKYFLVPLLFLNLAVFTALAKTQPDFLLHVDFLDVGQGDSIFIQTYLGNQIVIDGGPSDQILPALGQVMPFFDRSIDVLILTHPDADHVSGLSDVLKRYKVGKVIMTGVSADTAAYRQFADLVDKKKIEKIYAHTGQRVWLDNATVFDVYYPSTEIAADNSLATNDRSVTGKLSFGKTHILFTADISSKVEDWLRPRFNLDSDILKVPHHGSRFSSSVEFLEEVSPAYAVIEVGAKNTYGHPTQEVLDKLNQAGVKVLRTDQDKTVRFVPDGVNLRKD